MKSSLSTAAVIGCLLSAQSFANRPRHLRLRSAGNVAAAGETGKTADREGLDGATHQDRRRLL